MRLSYLAIGDELLDGRVVDTNVRHVGRRIRQAGLLLQRGMVVADDVHQIAAAVAELAAHSDRVIVSGGCGPTTDDVTREAIALAAGVPVVRRADVADRIRAKFGNRGQTMPEINLRQADLPETARVLTSEVGTADACVTPVGAAAVYSLPGVPSEFEALFDQWIVPELTAALPQRVASSGLFGIGESRAGAIVEALGLHPELRVAYCAAWPVVQIELRATTASADAALDDAMAQLRSALAPWWVAADHPVHALTALLLERNWHIATAESCTGGLVGSLLTDIPGSSAWFEQGWATYSYAAKMRSLAVEASMLEANGAVSAPVVAQMALQARNRAEVEVAIATSGVAGPGGGTPEKPVGTLWIGIATELGVTTIGCRLRSRDRASFKQVAAACALLATERVLRGRAADLRQWSGVLEVHEPIAGATSA